MFNYKLFLNKVHLAVPTPFPGTPLYQRLSAEGRLMKARSWDRCTLFDLNFEPKNMTVQELEDGMMWLFQEVYNQDALTTRRRHYMNIVKSLMS